MKAHRNLGVYLPLLAACNPFVLASGCNRPLSPAPEAEAPAVVEAPDAKPAMSPAQRMQEYEAAYEKGVELADKGQYAHAMQFFEQALTLMPSSVEALFNLGACHEAIGDPLRAINIYRRVLEIDPDDPDCYANLGTSFIKMYLRDKSPSWRKMARDAWQHSLMIKPNQPRVKEYLAQSESFD
ncbi:MAG TPA: tetratricopeptide repeat protein [Phycisphaerae bacterium]|nr:tetratricopeptide repeat protein [Phycisphaerae bacterium]